MDMFHEHSVDPTIWIQSNFFQEIVKQISKTARGYSSKKTSED